jgi:hypothetical protein
MFEENLVYLFASFTTENMTGIIDVAIAGFAAVKASKQIAQ